MPVSALKERQWKWLSKLPSGERKATGGKCAELNSATAWAAREVGFCLYIQEVWERCSELNTMGRSAHHKIALLLPS
jgi:hypothetical protein